MFIFNDCILLYHCAFCNDWWFFLGVSRVRVKSVLDQLNLLVFAVISVDRDHIKPARRIEQIILKNKELRAADDFLLFNGNDRVLALPMGCGLAGFNFDKTKGIAIIGNDVDFTEFSAEILYKNAIAIFN